MAGALLIIGCHHAPTAPAPFLSGTITSRAPGLLGVQTPNGVQLDSYPRMLVIGGPSCDSQAYFSLRSVRGLWYAGGRAADTSALAVGAQVTVWATGVVLESCPPQVAADEIQIDREAPAAQILRPNLRLQRSGTAASRPTDARGIE